jgi:hypothetical protein
MKLRIAILLVILQISSVYAQEGKIVAVTAEKDVEIKNNDIAAARTTALALAARDAVEKGYGTYVQIQELPEARKILARAAAGLKYQILAEQQQKNRYWVKIQAEVIVPFEYVGTEEPEREQMGDSMNSFVQKYPQGEINWGEGTILAHGRGEITNTGPTGEDLAARAAEIDAKAHLMEIIKDIPVDDRAKAGQDEKMSFALEGFVKDAEVVAKTKAGTNVTVSVQATIRGVKGLTLTVLGYYTPPPPPPPPPPSKPSDQAQVSKKPLEDPRSFTGLVIDARNVQANASLFPKIQDIRQKDIYNVGQVNKEDLEKRGMASYAVVSRDAVISKLFPKATVLQVSYRSETSVVKKRQGDKPLVLKSVDAGGQLKTNLVLSEEDAEKIQQISDETNILKECRVIIVLSP